MTLGRLWWMIQHNAKRGLSATWHEHVITPQFIKRRSFKNQEKSPEPTPIHILTGIEQLPLTWWMLASWFHFTGKNWTVYLHGDASIEKKDVAPLLLKLSHAHYISSKEAEKKILPQLESYLQCLHYRKTHPLACKSFDMPLLTPAKRFIILDSDILFFQKPTEILSWVENTNDESFWFNQDALEPAPISYEEVEKNLGFSLWKKVNSGLCLLSKGGISLDFYEECLNKTSLAKQKPWRIEQTLLALTASKQNKGGLLPPNYEVSLGKHAQNTDLIARHYVGAVRARFYAEGVRLLKNIL